MRPILQVEKLSAGHDSTQLVLQDIDFKVDAAEAVGFIGRNGAGKSTLGYALLGIIPQLFPGQARGKITICGRNFSSAPLQERLDHISYTWQDIESQILFGSVREYLELDNKACSPLLPQVIELLRITHLLDRPADQLSAGESQRVVLANAIRREVSLLIYDETTSALDARARQDFSLLLNLLKEHGNGIILLGQRESIVSPHCDRFFYLEGGRLLPPTSDRRQPYDWESEQFQPILNLQYPAKVRLAGVSSRRREQAFVLGPLDLVLDEGETVALLGPGGAGKTTLISLLGGAVKTECGSIEIAGCYYDRRNWKLLAEKCESVTQSPLSRIIGATIGEELLSVLDNDAAKELYRIAHNTFGYLDVTRDPLELSFGQQRILTFLTAILSTRHAVVLLDEPEQGLDTEALDFTRSWIVANRVSRRRTVLYSTHDFEVAAWADRCLLMNDGKIIDELCANDPNAIKQWYFRRLYG